MFEKLVPLHLKEIDKLGYKNNCILVYKGFPVNFLFELNNSFPFLNDKDQIFTSNKIDLKKITDNIGKLVKKLLGKIKGMRILTYEELILLSQKIDISLLSGKMIIFENNLFNEYPNQSTKTFIDIEDEIEKNNLNFKDDEIFNTFYTNSSLSNGLSLIQYRDIDFPDTKNVVRKLFFGKEILDLNLNYEEVDPEQLSNQDIITFPSSNAYCVLKNRLFVEKRIGEQQLLVSDSLTLSNEVRKNELKILQFIFKINNADIKILIKRNILNNKFRNDFLVILKQYWKSDCFRELMFYKDPDLNTEKTKITQGEVIEEIVKQCELAKNNENFNDIFLTSPTGSGKSVLFQIPATYLAKKYGLMTLVISPLKALMYDQIYALKNRGINFAAFINSDIALVEREKIIDSIKKGEISILYLSPELLLSYDLKNFIGDRIIGLFVIDEAHLVTTWGRDFRVDYWYLGNYIRKIRKYSNQAFCVFALTATAVYTGKNDIVFETIESLNMQTPKLYLGNVRRDEINFKISKFVVQGNNHELSKMEKTREIIMQNIDNKIKTIVYFPWTNQIKLMRDELPSNYQSKIGIYFGDVDKTEKQIVMHKFYEGEILVVLATKAFGMGVDISDIKIIYHHAPSGNLSDYIQEIGRVARDKSIKGKAIVDFCEKDLKFTKILYGLSSIKQYQVKLALEKIWDLYCCKKRANFLVSAEDFGFIFSAKTSDLETKVKSTLLLLEKDLQKKYGYYVIIVRPKSLFSTVFACINSLIEKDFLKIYGKFCEKVFSINENVRRGLESGAIIYDTGHIFKIELNKIWEEFFNNDSFPVVKWKFFDGSLFGQFPNSIHPKYKLTITLKYSKNDTLAKLNQYFTSLDNAFRKLQGKYFTKKDLDFALKQHFSDEVIRLRIVNLILNLYTSPSLFGEGGRMMAFDTFLQSKRNDNGEDIFRIANSAYLKVKHFAIRKFDVMFLTDSRLFNRYIAVAGQESEFRIKIAYLLESLSLASYEMVGGQLPQIFIRINDLYKIKLISKYQDYSNIILQDIENRHKSSVETMENFFTSNMNNGNRWDFIEDYFLGKEL